MSTTRTLLIDADDTLWENNIYYERVAGEFFAKLAARGMSEAQAQAALWQTEQRNIKITGYGSGAFCASLHETARELGVLDLEPWIQICERQIFYHPIELMPGVAETLPSLRDHNRLIVVTKGNTDEQLGKLRRSGLENFFHAVAVVFEKDAATYRQILADHKLLPAQTWMIGNSPRSDINPAKTAGLGTVFIPYHSTWQHELEEIEPNGGTIMLENFVQLSDHFCR